MLWIDLSIKTFKEGVPWHSGTYRVLISLKRVRDMIRIHSQMPRTDKYSKHSLIVWPVWLNSWVFVYQLSGCGFESRCSHWNLSCRTFLSKEFLDIQSTMKCGFTLRNMIITCSQMHCTDKNSQYSSIIWPVLLYGWVFAYELNCCEFESCCSHLWEFLSD